MNKVVGNIHFSPGRSFRTASQNIYELVPYLKEDGNRHDFTHTINSFAFQGDDEYDFQKADIGQKLKEKLGIQSNPLDGTVSRVGVSLHAAIKYNELTGCARRADYQAAIHVPVLLKGRLDAIQDARR